jgi:aminoglycoside phosphotransferase (APT) family kinase protein
MAAQNMPAAEIDVSQGLVRRLLDEQHPDMAGLAIAPLSNGWDNAIFRLADDHTVRLPRRQMAAVLVEHEQQWLKVLAPRLPIPIPVPARIGVPSDSFPWHWSVCPWFEGHMAADTSLADPMSEALRLGEFLASLHVAAPDDAPENPWRGQPLADVTPRFERNLEQLGTSIDALATRARWRELAEVPEWGEDPVWLHGDLHTANVLVSDGALSAVIDFGDITSGDPAVDLAIAWMLFDAPQRHALRSAAGGIDDATWSRGQAWALHFAVVYLLNSADNPRFQRMGTELLDTVLSG